MCYGVLSETQLKNSEKLSCINEKDQEKAEKLCLHSSSDTHRMCGGNTKETYLEILYFRQFYKHFVFAEDEEGNRNKRVEKYFEVSAVVDVGCGDT